MDGGPRRGVCGAAGMGRGILCCRVLGGGDHTLLDSSPGAPHKAWSPSRIPAQASCLPRAHFGSDITGRRHRVGSVTPGRRL